MSLAVERRLLQATVALLCLIPLTASAAGIWNGAAWLSHGQPVATDLDSHFRYLSGLFLGMAIGFASCVPAIERRGDRLRWFALLVLLGGLARLWSLAAVGTPSLGHVVGLCVELGAVPATVFWQLGFARRWAARG